VERAFAARRERDVTGGVLEPVSATLVGPSSDRRRTDLITPQLGALDAGDRADSIRSNPCERPAARLLSRSWGSFRNDQAGLTFVRGPESQPVRKALRSPIHVFATIFVISGAGCFLLPGASWSTQAETPSADSGDASAVWKSPKDIKAQNGAASALKPPAEQQSPAASDPITRGTDGQNSGFPNPAAGTPQAPRAQVSPAPGQTLDATTESHAAAAQTRHGARTHTRAHRRAHHRHWRRRRHRFLFFRF
jgi:hypothetical protein